MKFQQMTGFIVISFLSVLAGCSTSTPEANLQEANELKPLVIHSEGKTTPFYQLNVDSLRPVDNEIEGFTKTPSGLQYRILRTGNGVYPKSTDQVLAHYKGQLTNGKEFDSSYSKKPLSFFLNRVVAGWTEGMQHIDEGGMIELILPYELGYGEKGDRGIPPKATLQFIVELQKVN